MSKRLDKIVRAYGRNLVAYVRRCERGAYEPYLSESEMEIQQIRRAWCAHATNGESHIFFGGGF